MSEYKDGHGDRYLAAGLSEELEEARAYASGLLDRIWSLGQELERVRTALESVSPADACDIAPHGDQYVCRYHRRYFGPGEICPGLRL